MKTDKEYLEIALELLSDKMECKIERKDLEGIAKYYKSHCTRCDGAYDKDFLKKYGICKSCYAKDVE